MSLQHELLIYADCACMLKVEHIILTLTKPREYYPPEDAPLELGPTQACTEAIKCLEMHCKLLKGSTSKEVLEVFYQEIGIRLIAWVIFLTLVGWSLMPFGWIGYCKSILRGRLYRLMEASRSSQT